MTASRSIGSDVVGVSIRFDTPVFLIFCCCCSSCVDVNDHVLGSFFLLGASLVTPDVVVAVNDFFFAFIFGLGLSLTPTWETFFTPVFRRRLFTLNVG
jgi:hypothetical protein